MRRIILLLVLPIALGACAPVHGSGTEARTEPRACFLAQQVTSFRADARQNVYIRTVGRDVFRLDTVCPGLETNIQIGLDTGPGSFNRLCEGDSVRLIGRGHTSDVQSCPARVVARLTEAEIEALPARDRP